MHNLGNRKDGKHQHGEQHHQFHGRCAIELALWLHTIGHGNEVLPSRQGEVDIDLGVNFNVAIAIVFQGRELNADGRGPNGDGGQMD